MTSLITAEQIRIAGRLHSTRLEVAEGSLVAVVGPNGGGKTSLLHALAAVPPALGDVRVAGEAVRGQSPARRQRLIGLLTADRHVSWPITGHELIALGAAPPTELGPIVEALDLRPLLDRRVDRLSSGERARLLLGRLLARAPHVLLLDEPLANLDPYWQEVLMALLRDRSKYAGCSVVLAIHDLATATRFADRLLLMSDGAIAWDGPPDGLKSSGEADRVFGAEWTGAGWRLSYPADQRSSR